MSISGAQSTRPSMAVEQSSSAAGWVLWRHGVAVSVIIGCQRCDCGGSTTTSSSRCVMFGKCSYRCRLVPQMYWFTENRFSTLYIVAHRSRIVCLLKARILICDCEIGIGSAVHVDRGPSHFPRCQDGACLALWEFAGG